MQESHNNSSFSVLKQTNKQKYPETWNFYEIPSTTQYLPIAKKNGGMLMNEM